MRGGRRWLEGIYRREVIDAKGGVLEREEKDRKKTKLRVK